MEKDLITGVTVSALQKQNSVPSSAPPQARGLPSARCDGVAPVLTAGRISAPGSEKAWFAASRPSSRESSQLTGSCGENGPGFGKACWCE